VKKRTDVQVGKGCHDLADDLIDNALRPLRARPGAVYREGKLTIGFRNSSGGKDKDHFAIELIDAASHAVVLEIEANPDSFARALASHGHQPCRFRLLGVHLVGSRHEHKTEVIKVPDVGGTDATLLKREMKALEVDGWVGRADDLLNWHRRKLSRDGKSWSVSVTFDRYVKKGE
jgi:hypothetical protein